MNKDDIGWGDVYRERITNIEFIRNVIAHFLFLIDIYKCSPESIIEVGCGTASHSIFLSYIFRNSKFVCVDKNERVVQQAKNNIRKYNRDIKCYCADAFNLGDEFRDFDVAFCQGVLEHFSNDTDFETSI